MSVDPRDEIMRMTALKFFPRVDEVTVGIAPNPYAIFTKGTVKCEVRVPSAVPLDDFESEAWFAFRHLARALDMNDVAEHPVDQIVIDVEQ